MVDDSPHTARGAAPTRSLKRWFSDMPRWEKIALGVAVSAVVVGGVWSVSQGHSPIAAPGGSGGGGTVGAGALGATLTDGSIPRGAGTTTTATEEPASKGIFRLGFSFVAGFSIGAFIRATLKIAAIAFGFWLLMTFVLAYLGVLVVDWEAINGLWNRFTANVESEWGSFQTFITGSLPATALAATGLAVGLRRH